MTIHFPRYLGHVHPITKKPLPADSVYYCLPGGEIATAEFITRWGEEHDVRVMLLTLEQSSPPSC